jgi:hypothetical protein
MGRCAVLVFSVGTTSTSSLINSFAPSGAFGAASRCPSAMVAVRKHLGVLAVSEQRLITGNGGDYV